MRGKRLFCLIITALSPVYPVVHASDIYTLPAIVVTAAKTEEAIKKEPQPVEVVTAEEIRRLGAYDTVTALGTALDLDLTSSHPSKTAMGGGMGGNAVMLRGMNTNHTLILVDGKRLAGEDTNVTQNFYALGQLDVDRIDRIEIVRGASSALYGSEAMGGVINIITKVPARKEMVVNVSAGTKEIKNGYHFDLGKEGRWSHSFDASFIRRRPVAYHETGKKMMSLSETMEVPVITDGENVPDDGNRQMFHWTSLYSFETAAQGKLRIDGGYLNENTRYRFADAVMEMPLGKKTLSIPYFKDRSDRIRRKGADLSLQYTGKTGKNEYSFSAGISHLKKDSESYNAGRSGTDKAEYTDSFLEAMDTVESGSHRVTFGGEYRMDRYNGSRLAKQSGGSLKMDSRSYQTEAVYLSDLWQAGRRIFLSPAVRLEHNSRFGSYTAPKMGLTYEWNEHTRFKANYGKGFKAPSISELYIRMENGEYVVLGNEALEPEKSESWDAGVEWERGRSFGKVTYFDNRVRNLIDYQKEEDDDRVFRYVNIDQARIRGTETEWGCRLNDRLLFTMSHVYLDAKGAKKGQPEARLDSRAKNTFIAKFIYDDHQDYGWVGTLWDRFAGDYQFDGARYSYALLNLSIRKKWSDSMSLSLSLYNLLDKEVDDLYIKGREWSVGAELKF